MYIVCLIFPYLSLTEAAVMESYIYIATLLVAVIVSGFCSPEDSYHIKALSNETCGSIQSCITLSEFAQQNGTSAKNTTLKFLPGEHTLSTNISVADTNSYSSLVFSKMQQLESSVRRKLVLCSPTYCTSESII